MSLTQIAAPYPIFIDIDGTPLDDGYLYIGEVSKNPETNPIAVYWDSEFKFPAAQPIRTNNGYPWRMGTPANIYCSQQFSITVRNKKKELVTYSPIGVGYNSVGSFELLADGTQNSFSLPFPPNYARSLDVYIDGVYQNKNSYSTTLSQIIFSETLHFGAKIELNYN